MNVFVPSGFKLICPHVEGEESPETAMGSI